MVAKTLGVKLIVIARLLRKRFDHSADNIGVTRAQWTAIGAVARAPGATQRVIASMLDVGEAAAGRLIDRLCEEGWMERRQDPQDRRSNRVYLKPAANDILQQLSGLAAEQDARAFSGISQEEITLFNNILDRVAANLGAAEERALKNFCKEPQPAPVPDV